MTDDELRDIGMHRCECGEAVYPNGIDTPHCAFSAPSKWPTKSDSCQVPFPEGEDDKLPGVPLRG